MLLLLSFYGFTVIVTVTHCMPFRVQTCTELQPQYLLTHAIPNRYKLPRGVSIHYDEEHSIHSYTLGQHAGTLHFPATEIFTRCTYWPDEYSILATFKLDQDSDTPEWEDGYLFSLIPDGGADIKLGVSISRTKVTVYYSDYRVPPGKRTASFDRQLYDGQWHTIIVTMAGQQVALRVDCGELISQKFKRNYPAFLDTTGDNIHVGNRKIQPGQLRGSIKQLLLLPGADAGQLACPSPMPAMPEIATQPDIQMESTGMYEVQYQIPYDAGCTWKETGKMWYDIYTQQLKVCHSGAWRAAATQPAAGQVTVKSAPKLDYFTKHQTIDTISPAIDLHVFSMELEGTFVVMANNNPEARARTQRSILYKWDADQEYLLPYQNISTTSPSCWTSFHMGKHFYLVVANMEGARRGVDAVVTVYRWNKKRKIFKQFQDINSKLPRDIEHFTIDGEDYLAVGNHADQTGKTTDYTTNSFIYKYYKSEKSFIQIQKIQTTGVYDWTYFSESDKAGNAYHFLMASNSIDGAKTSLLSYLYVWDRRSAYFVKFQNIETHGATDAEYFTIDGESYLALANGVSSLDEGTSVAEKYTAKSVIYKANKQKNRMEVFQTIQTYGINDWEFFTIGNDSYLIGSNHQPHRRISSQLVPELSETIIYRYQGAEKFVPAHKITTYPSSDWEAIYSNDNVYLIYANGGGKVTEIFKAKYR